ncbi:hypothetical protein VNI00_016913 [Paramarasmius palmivorus]|uniref:Microsomal glutathione S-transferase 3 n=1 Tax=Paramarasmius palmivorus TaxID=297713 RepID=A0AAW0B9W3_9AGAR
MPTTVVVPDGLPLVGASLLSTAVLLLGQVFIVGRRRKVAKIPYPQMYADKAQEEASFDAKKFNCAQRAHQNTLESIPIIYLTTALSAVEYPVLAASLCGLWTVSRVFYTRGYITGDPQKRLRGGFPGSIALVGLLGTSMYVVGQSVKAYLGF